MLSTLELYREGHVHEVSQVTPELVEGVTLEFIERVMLMK